MNVGNIMARSCWRCCSGWRWKELEIGRKGTSGSAMAREGRICTHCNQVQLYSVQLHLVLSGHVVVLYKMVHHGDVSPKLF